MTSRQIGRLAMATTVAVMLGLVSGARAQTGPSPAPAYPTSPWHGMLDGDGRPIPCRCRFDGREWRLGELICMHTHVGTVLARCDLILNNTSWVPTDTPCTTSLWRQPGRTVAGAR